MTSTKDIISAIHIRNLILIMSMSRWMHQCMVKYQRTNSFVLLQKSKFGFSKTWHLFRYVIVDWSLWTFHFIYYFNQGNFQIKEISGDQNVFVDQTYNVCNVASRGFSNIIIKQLFNMLSQQLKFPMKCPFKKVYLGSRWL